MNMMSIGMKVMLILLGFIPMLVAKRIASRFYHPIAVVRGSDIIRYDKLPYNYKTSSPVIGMIIEALLGIAIYFLSCLWKQELIIIFIGSMLSAIYLMLVELIYEREFKPILMYPVYALFIVLYLLNII